jgi:hypothetical protein
MEGTTDIDDGPALTFKGGLLWAVLIIPGIVIMAVGLLILLVGRPIIEGTAYLFHRSNGGGPLNIETPTEIDQ